MELVDFDYQPTTQPFEEFVILKEFYITGECASENADEQKIDAVKYSRENFQFTDEGKGFNVQLTLFPYSGYKFDTPLPLINYGEGGHVWDQLTFIFS